MAPTESRIQPKCGAGTRLKLWLGVLEVMTSMPIEQIHRQAQLQLNFHSDIMGAELHVFFTGLLQAEYRNALHLLGEMCAEMRKHLGMSLPEAELELGGIFTRDSAPAGTELH